MDNSEIKNQIYRGGAPVGYLSELSQLEQNAIIFLRYWSQCAKADHDLQNNFWSNITYDLGITKTRQAIDAFDEIFTLCAKYSRRPIMKHDLECKCIGGDESCFANIIGFAQVDELEDALLLASNLVAPKFAACLVTSARKFAESITISECNPLEAEESYYQNYNVH
jgi:hypothetical protein